MAADRFVDIGRIVGLHGVQGWVKLESYTEPRTQLFRYQPWVLELRGSDLEVRGAEGREAGRGLIGKLPGFDDRDAAATLIGAAIRVRRSVLPKAKRGEFYWADLEGLEVVDTQGKSLGTVSHLFATGANDVLVVRDGKREHMVPFLPTQVVRDVDLERGRIVVDWDIEF